MESVKWGWVAQVHNMAAITCQHAGEMQIIFVFPCYVGIASFFLLVVDTQTEREREGKRWGEWGGQRVRQIAKH